MEFQLLGPFEARADGRPIAVGTRRQERLLLAALLLDAGRVVPIDRLIDLLWEREPPRSARGAIHTYVGRLRQSLAPYGVVIVTRGDGYLLDPAGHRVDAAEFLEQAQNASTQRRRAPGRSAPLHGAPVPVGRLRLAVSRPERSTAVVHDGPVRAAEPPLSRRQTGPLPMKVWRWNRFQPC